MYQGLEEGILVISNPSISLPSNSIHSPHLWYDKRKHQTMAVQAFPDRNHILKRDKIKHLLLASVDVLKFAEPFLLIRGWV
jgi:hypothetical protein